MKVSMKLDYGVRVLVDLAQHHGQGVIPASEIAGRQGIPEPYLDQILAALRRAGFVSSKRGPQGGHMLDRSPSQVNLGEVIAALEGSSSPRCITQPEDCERATICVQREVWQAIEESAQRLLTATTLGELVERQERRSEAAMYYI